MKQEKIIMGMTVKIEIADSSVNSEIFEKIFSYFKEVDQKFSTYKADSEISRINSGHIKKEAYSGEMQEVFALAEQTKNESGGYFDIMRSNGTIDPSGLVKGWAIKKAGELLKKEGYKNFYIDIGGDIEVRGDDESGNPWQIGIRNPFKINETIKVLSIKDRGVATSGNYVHNSHIYNPKNNSKNDKSIVSLTVIGPNIYEADRFATASFAMGSEGIYFIEKLKGFEGYMIDEGGIATMTTGFEQYVV